MNELALIEIVGGICVPVFGAIIGFLMSSHRATVTELKARDKELELKIEAHQQEASQWRLEATEKFAQRAETEREFTKMETMLLRMETKLDTVVQRLIPQAINGDGR